jgi:histone H3/H4
MSHHHHHDHDHDHEHEHDDRRENEGAPDTGFLDLEISKVLFSEAEAVTREAYRELLKEAAKRRLQERWGDRITALATLAVDELLDDVDANLAIEAQISARKQARQTIEDRVGTILGPQPKAQDEPTSE